MKALRNFLFPSLLVAGFSDVSAATLAFYAFTPGTHTSPNTVDPSIMASTIDQSVGSFDVSSTSGTAFLRASSSEGSLAQAIANPDYIQFTIQPKPGQIINLETFVFDHEASNGTTTAFTSNLSIFASVTGFAVAPAPGDALGTSTTAVDASIGGDPSELEDDVAYSLAAPQFQGLTSATTVTFRVYGFDDGTLTDQINRIDDLRVIGTAIPEPGCALLAVAGLGLAALRRRR